MKKMILVSGCLMVLTLLTGCPCKRPVIASLNVTLRPQETSLWCWAASGEMVMEFLGKSVSQCDEANKRFGYTNCCNSPTPSACVNGGWPEFDKYGFTFKTTSNAALNWSEVKNQIYCKSKPFAFTWHWPGGGGHMMVAFGYVTIGTAKYVAVNDPGPPNIGDQYMITYDYYVSSTGDHTHWNDYYDVTPK